MILPPDKESLRRAFIPLRNTLKEICDAMDYAYGVIASQYGFECKGCEDNCCRSRFHHHTYVEYFYLLEGFHQLEPATQSAVRQSAENMSYQESRSIRERFRARPMCPLNVDGLCALYPYRPMICRLHGIPHELKPPGKGKILSPGCRAFERQNNDRMHLTFDRTPLYTKMAVLEKKLRYQAGIKNKIKMTVAQMIFSFIE